MLWLVVGLSSWSWGTSSPSAPVLGRARSWWLSLFVGKSVVGFVWGRSSQRNSASVNSAGQCYGIVNLGCLPLLCPASRSTVVDTGRG